MADDETGPAPAGGTGIDVEDAADELYAQHPDAFVGRRDELVAAARARKDREGARAIGALRKPSHAAWLANLLAREQPDEVAALVELGAAVRVAQDRLSGDALRETQRQRRALIGALVARARALAREHGVTVGTPTERELERTVAAALADATIARAFARGRLVTALEPGATLGAPGTDGLSDAGATSPRPPRRPARRDAPSPAAPATDPATGESEESDRAEREERERAQREERERAQREEADRVVEQARHVLAEAERSASAAGDAVTAARTAQETATAAVDDLEARLDRARADAREAEDATVARRRDQARADTAVVRARRDVEEAEARRVAVSADQDP